MGQTVKLRRSAISGKIPINSQLQLGELSMNTTDGKIFLSKSGSNGPSVEEVIITNTQNFGSIDIVGSISGSFLTGSFIGDGGGLYNIPASGVTGLSLDRIASSTSTASIDADGLHINTDTTVTGSLTATEFTGSGLGLTDVPIKISGSDAGSTSIDSTFTRIKFDDSTGIKISGTTGGDAVVYLSGVASESDGGEGKTAKLEVTGATSTWTLNHNLNEKHPSIEVFDSNDEVIIPQKIEATSNNQVVVSFASPQTGTVTATVGGGLPSIDSGYEGRVLSVDSSGVATWKDTILSGSIDFSTLTDTGSFNTYTSSADGRLDSIETTSGSHEGRLDSLETTSGSYSGRLDSLEEFTSSIDETYATDSDVTTLRTDLNSYSSSTDGRLDSLETTSGSSNLRLDYIESVTSSHNGRLNSLETISSSHDGRLDSIESNTGSYLISSDLSTLEGRANSLETTSGSHNTRLTDLETFETKVDTGLEFTGSNVTIKGNLLVKGTETRVDSTTVDIDDNIISLNGSGAVNAGIEVRDTESPGVLSGSLIYDTGDNVWKAGIKGSEERLLINSDLTTLDGRLDSLESTSGSHEDRLDRIETSTSSLNSFTSSINTTIKDKLNNDGVISGSVQIDHDATTNYEANEHIDHSTITIGSGKGLTGGGTIDTSRSLTLNTGSNHFLDGVKSKLNTETVVSGSEQIDITGTTNYNLVDGRLDSIESFTGSIDNTYATDSDVTTLRTDLNTYTSSTDNRLDSLETTSGSHDGRLDSIESNTGSYLTSYNDEYTTGATFSTSNGVVRFTRNDGDTYTVDLDGRYLTSFTETDPIFTASPSAGITETNITNWDAAYGWGDHSQEGYLTSYNDEYTTGATFNGSNGIITFTRNDGDTYTLNISSTLTDINVTGGTYNDSSQTLTLNKSNGTSIDVTGFAVDTVLHTTGSTFNTGTGVVTFTKNGGDTYTVDLDGRYLTSFTETDPIFTAHAVYDITSTQISNWDTAYGWGDHSQSGYLTTYNNEYTTGATFNTGTGVVTFTRNDGDTFTVDIDGRFLTSFTETDPIFTASAAYGITSTNISNWNTAYGWGDHSQAGYLTSYNNEYVTGASFNTGNGIITFTRNDGDTFTVDIDGKYAESGHNHDSAYVNVGGDTMTGTLDVHVGDTGTILSSGNASATGTPDQFFIKHVNGGVAIGNLRGDINFTNGNLKNDGNLIWDAGDFTSTNISNWNTAYGWGDHSQAGYITSYVNTNEFVTGATFSTSNGVVTFTRNNGGDTFNVDLDGRYLTSFTETDPIFTASPSAGITETNITNWDAAYGWGDHSQAGYLTSYNDEYTTGATFNGGNGIITFTRNDGDTFTLDISATLTDINVTGGTYNDSNQTLTLNKSNGGSIDITGFAVDTVLHTTGATFNTSNGVVTFTKSNGDTYTVDLDGKYAESGHNHDSTYLKLAGGTLTGGLNGTTGTFSGKGTFDNLELTSGNRHLTFTQSGDDWSIMNDQQNNGIILYNGTGGVEIQYSGTTIAEFENGTIKFHEQLDMGTNIITDTKVGQWNTAYGWGDHSQAGYVTSSGNTVIGIDSDINTSGSYVVNELTMTDGVITNHSTRQLSQLKIPDTRTAEISPNDYADQHLSLDFTDEFGSLGSWYSGITLKGWTGSYAAWQLISEADSGIGDTNLYFRQGNGTTWQSMRTVWTSANFSNNSSDWDTAFGWGDHSQAGYLTSYVNTNEFTTGATFNSSNGVVTFTRNNGGDTYTVDLDGRYLTSYSETDTLDTVTTRGATTSNIITVGGVNLNDGNSIIEEASGDAFRFKTSTGYIDIGSKNTGWIHFEGNRPYYFGTSSTAFDGDVRPYTNNTRSLGSTSYRWSAIYANGGDSTEWNSAYGWGDHSQAGYLTSYNDEYTTGATFNTSNGVVTFTRNDGDQYTVDLDGRYLTSYNNEYTNSASFNTSNGIITFTRNDGDTYTVDIDGKYSDTTHKYHSFSDGDEFYDGYGQNNYLRLFTENAVHDNFRFRSWSNLEYWDGSSWVSWSQNIDTLFDGLETTGFNLSQTHKKFRFEINRSSGWPTTALFVIQSTWSDISNTTGSVVLETHDGSQWNQKDSWTYGSYQRGYNLHTTTQTHDGKASMRVTIDLSWTNNSHDYTPLRRILMLSNYSGNQYDMKPFKWEYNQDVTFASNIKVSGGESTEWNTAYGWGDHSQAGYLTSSSTQSKYLRSDTDDTTTGTLTIGDGSNQARLKLKKADNNTADHIEFYNGTTRVGEIGTSDDTWLRLNNLTNKNIYTPRYIRADEGFFVDSTSKGINGSGNFIGGTIAGASDANVTNWDAAYEWGDHSTVGYLTGYTDNNDYTTGATFNGSNGIVTFTRNDGGTYTVDISSTLTDVTVTGGTYNDSNQTLTLTKSDGGSVDVTGFAVDTVLHTTGSTFNSSNGVITFTKNSGDTYTVDIDGRYMTEGLTLSNPDTIENGGNRYDPSTNSPTNEHYAIITYGNGGNVTGQLATHFQTGKLYSRGHNNSWSDWRTYWSDSDFTSTDVSNWDTAYGWGDHSSVGYITGYTETQTLDDVTTLGATTSNDLTVGGLTVSATFPYLDFVDTNSFTDTADRFRVRAGGNNGQIQWFDSSAATTSTLMTFLPDGKITMGNGIQFTAAGGVDMGTNTITDTTVGNWNTAYGWGDHSQEGYLTNLPTHNHDSLYVNLSGDTMTGDLTVGSTSRASNTVIKALSDDSHRSGFEAYGSSQGNGYLYVGQSTSHGGGISYNGDSSPAYVGGETSDYITFYRREAGTNTEVFAFPYSSNEVYFNGNVHSGGGNSSQWNTAVGWGDHSQAGYITSFDNDIDYISSASFDTATGVITGTGVGNAGFTVDIDGRYLGLSDKAADSDKLDGVDSSEFLRSNVADTFTGTITMGTQKALVANNYGRGVYGLYSASRYQHVWSMGTAYNLSDDGSTSGNLYGLAFTHTNVGGQSKDGLAHQLLIMDNGVTKSAIGRGIWTDGTITTTSHGTSEKWADAYSWGNHASAGYASSSHTHAASDITSGTFAAARFATSTRYNIGLITGYDSQSRDKLRVWDSGSYSIGMKSGYDYGHIGSGEYAMSFQMSNTDGRGWWWGDDAHNDDQGAASLTTQGKMVIAKSLSIGQGELITNPSDTPLYVEGTTAGETVFEVQGTSGQLFSITDSLIGDIFEVSDISGIPILTVNSSGVVTVDDTLHVTGDVIAYYASDKRLKDNIKPIENAIDKIKMIGGYEFDWNSNSRNNNGHDVGVIAQEIEEVLPELVGTRSDGYKGVKYEKLTALLIQSNKELIARVEELESKLKE